MTSSASFIKLAVLSSSSALRRLDQPKQKELLLLLFPSVTIKRASKRARFMRLL